jgi:hypothetical protein
MGTDEPAADSSDSSVGASDPTPPSVAEPDGSSMSPPAHEPASMAPEASTPSEPSQSPQKPNPEPGGSSKPPSQAQPKPDPGAQPVAAIDWDKDCELRPIFRAHGKAVAGDETPFEVAPDTEDTRQFIYTTAWPGEMHMLAVRPVDGNRQVTHHWGLYTLTNVALNEGEILKKGNFLDTLKISSSQLLVGAGPGASTLVMPPGIGAAMPVGSNTGFALEIHYFNVGATEIATDNTGIELCLTSKPVMSEAAIHVLGPLTFSLPAHERTDVTSICRPEKMSEPVHLMAVTPHMHATGAHAKLVLQRASGEQVIVHDGDYASKEQRTYMLPDVIVQDGDTLTTTCTFDNQSDHVVPRGDTADDEMCFMMLWAWPTGVLQNGQLLGARVAVPEDRDCLEP